MRLHERVDLLRSADKLTAETLRNYYGETRFDQVAESNMIEGSSLDAGETKLAVLKGTTVLHHDSQYVQDAVSLNKALVELETLARDSKPLTIPEASRLHELVLAGRPGAGSLRKDAVSISGSQHTPPRTWTEVTTLELIRAGYPPLIIRNNRDRDRYIDALERADFGDLRSFLELITDRATDALRDLERSAAKHQGYNPLVQKERKAYENRVGLWNVAVSFLYEAILFALRKRLEGSDVELRPQRFGDVVLDDFIDLSKGDRVSQSWAFSIRCSRPGRRVRQARDARGTSGCN